MEITLNKLCKKYGKLKVLNEVSLSIAPGQIIALLGQNGAGKTTLLRCLSAVVAPDSGDILYDNEKFSRARLDLRRWLIFIPDRPVVYSDYSTIKHISMVLGLYGVDGRPTEEKEMEILREFDLLPHARLPMALLSRGQSYKAGLSAAIALSPELWLLDEPFASGMDPSGIIAFKRFAQDAAKAGRTIIYTTQLLDIAERFCDRICVIHKGDVVAFETIAELRDRTGGKDDALTDLFLQLRER